MKRLLALLMLPILSWQATAQAQLAQVEIISEQRSPQSEISEPSQRSPRSTSKLAQLPPPSKLAQQSDYNYEYQYEERYEYEQHHEERSRTSIIDVGVILTLISTLSRSGGNTQTVDLSPEIAEIRGNISRLYLLLARQYLIQDQIYEACTAIDNSLVAEHESYLRRKLAPINSPSSDCNAQALSRISQITNSPTGIIYPVISADGVEILFVPPNRSPRDTAKAKLLKSMGFNTAQQDTANQPVSRLVRGANEKVLESTVAEFVVNLQDPTSVDYMRQAPQLYDWLIRPIEKEIEAAGVETLVFVMDGALRVVPPAAFYDQTSDRFLVEKYATVTVPAMSLTSLEPPPRSLNLQVLSMGLSESVAGFNPLPAARTEVNTIADQVLKGDVFLNDDFTIGNLRKYEQDKYRHGIVHLATHAEFLSEKPEDSYILMWDEKLSVKQIAAMDLSGLAMLTLSACKTAVGQNLGISGTAVGSKAGSVLASLWSVSDAGTAPLMLSFYSRYAQTKSKAIALQQAQLALLNEEVTVESGKIMGIPKLDTVSLDEGSSVSLDLSHPFYWSSFLLVGNWL
jgi:CHAT domain-containing protein